MKGSFFSKMENGWIKLYRKVEQNDFLMTDNTAFLLFSKLLLFANREGGWYRTATRNLALRANLPHSTTYKALKRLEDEGLITIEVHDLFSKIFITNWTVYQSNREIDTLLEHNVPQGRKRPAKRLTTGVKSSSRNASGNTNETQRKRAGNADETYNKKEELRIKKKNINTLASPEHEEISKLFYEAIKSNNLPTLNHTVIKAKIKQMTTEVEHDKLKEYLVFVRDQYRTIEIEYKPQLNNALDIYSKRVQIENALKLAIKEQQQNKVFRV